MKKIITCLAVMIITGCAMTYTAPVTEPVNVSQPLNVDRDLAFANAKREFLTSGYQLQVIDEKAGIITTSFTKKKLTPEDADCGTTMGIDYLKDYRTEVRVALYLVINESEISVKANLEGEYKPGDVAQDISLTCISKGVIERQMLSNINR